MAVVVAQIRLLAIWQATVISYRNVSNVTYPTKLSILGYRLYPMSKTSEQAICKGPLVEVQMVGENPSTGTITRLRFAQYKFRGGVSF